METVTLNLVDRINYGLKNPMRVHSLKTRQFGKEEEGRFRDALTGLEAEAVYSKRNVRSEFIENIRLSCLND